MMGKSNFVKTSFHLDLLSTDMYPQAYLQAVF